MFVAGDVPGDEFARPFGVADFAEDAAAGRGDAFDGTEGAVWIVSDVHGWGAGFVAVMGGDLPLCGEVGDDCRAGIEPSFAVGERNRVDVTDNTVGKPWRHVLLTRVRA